MEEKEAIQKAIKAVEKAQTTHDKALDKLNELEVAYAAEYLKLHKDASIVEVDKYLQSELRMRYEDLAREKDNLAREMDNLAREKNKEVLILQQQQAIDVAPEQILNYLYGFDIESSQVSFTRPLVTLEGIKTNEVITYIPPLMKFVCREEPTQILYKQMDRYLNWKANSVGEDGKNIKFITVEGTPGKGKTTFARRFLELSYTGKYSHIINDCRNTNRRYRVTCSSFQSTSDPETQLSLLVLYEAFNHLIPAMKKGSILGNFLKTFPNGRLSLLSTLELITRVFCSDASLPDDERMVIINLDETEALLGDNEGIKFFKKLLTILFQAGDSLCLVTILSGTHSMELFSFNFVDIDLPLIDLKGAKEVILGMTSNPSGFSISPYLEHLLTLCGGIGRYIEDAIIQMSMMGQAEMDGTAISGFKLDAYEYFMKNLQTRDQTFVFQKE